MKASIPATSCYRSKTRHFADRDGWIICTIDWHSIAPDALLACFEIACVRETRRAFRKTTPLATYAPKLKREDGKIDWSEPAELIERKIRAFNPWPGAFMKIDGRNLKIFSASIVDFSGSPAKFCEAKGTDRGRWRRCGFVTMKCSSKEKGA